jgi:hypothetical protein
LHVLSSFQRTGPACAPNGASARHPSDCLPRLVGVPNRRFDRVQGNLPTLLQPFLAVNSCSRSDTLSPLEAKAAATPAVGRPSVVVSDLGARRAGNLGTSAAPEREQRFERTPKAKLDTTRRRWACQPVIPTARERFFSLRSGSTPARVTQRLPHIRQANRHVSHSVPVPPGSVNPRQFHASRRHMKTGPSPVPMARRRRAAPATTSSAM